MVLSEMYLSSMYNSLYVHTFKDTVESRYFAQRVTTFTFVCIDFRLDTLKENKLTNKLEIMKYENLI